MARYNNTDYSLLKYGNYSMLVFTVISLFGWAILAGFWPPPEEYLSATEIGNYYRENSFNIRLGMAITLNAVPFYLVWGKAHCIS